MGSWAPGLLAVRLPVAEVMTAAGLVVVLAAYVGTGALAAWSLVMGPPIPPSLPWIILAAIALGVGVGSAVASPRPAADRRLDADSPPRPDPATPGDHRAAQEEEEPRCQR